MREEDLNKSRDRVADAAFYLGQSLYAQGKYRESAAAFEKTANVRTDDATILNNLGQSLSLAGDYARAELLYRRALAIGENTLGTDNPVKGMSLNGLANLLLQAKGDYAGAGTVVSPRTSNYREGAWAGPSGHGDIAE